MEGGESGSVDKARSMPSSRTAEMSASVCWGSGNVDRCVSHGCKRSWLRVRRVAGSLVRSAEIRACQAMITQGSGLASMRVT